MTLTGEARPPEVLDDSLRKLRELRQSCPDGL
jgi:hypothetical protein